MGKGDKKTRRGKFFNGSFGKTRPRKKVKTIVAPLKEKKKTSKKVKE